MKHRIPPRRVPRPRTLEIGGTQAGGPLFGGAPYLPIQGGTLTGDLIIEKAAPRIFLTVTDNTTAGFIFKDGATERYSMGYKDTDNTFHLNILGSIDGRSDFVMENTGRVAFAQTPVVIGTKVFLESGGTLTGNLILLQAAPRLRWEEDDASADNSVWDILVQAEQFRLRILNDAKSTGANALEIDRTGNTVDLINLLGPTKVATFGVGVTPISKPTVSGSRAGNAALASLLTELANYGLITDSSS